MGAVRLHHQEMVKYKWQAEWQSEQCCEIKRSKLSAERGAGVRKRQKATLAVRILPKKPNVSCVKMKGLAQLKDAVVRCTHNEMWLSIRLTPMNTGANEQLGCGHISGNREGSSSPIFSCAYQEYEGRCLSVLIERGVSGLNVLTSDQQTRARDKSN